MIASSVNMIVMYTFKLNNVLTKYKLKLNF